MQMGFVLLDTKLDTAARQLMGLSDLEFISFGSRNFIVASGEADGGLSSFEIMAGGALAAVDDILLDAGSGTTNVRGLTSYEVEGVTYITPMGRYDDNMSIYSLDENGQFALEHSHAGAGYAQMVASTSVNLDGTSVYYSATTSAGLNYYTLDLAGDFVSPQNMADTSTTSLGDISVLETGNLQGNTFLFVASSWDAGIAVYKIDASGDPEQTFYLEPGAVGFNAPSAITTYQIDGRGFVVMASAETDALLVFRVSKGGQLKLVDEMIDISETRFARASVLEPFEKDGRHFLLAAGSDDGLTLFEIDYRGRLKLISVLADDFDTTLNNISDIEFAEIGGEMYVFVGSPTEHGFTQFLLDLDPGGIIRGGNGFETITGTAGDDTIFGHGGRDIIDGGAGDDRLVDGRGRDILTGGSGADVFEFIDDGKRDRIMDYEIGIDKLDFTNFSRLYSFHDVEILSRDDGAVLKVGDDELRIYSADGLRIDVTSWTQDDFIFG